MDKKRARFRDLGELSPVIGIIDDVLVELLAKRGLVSIEVGEFKSLNEQKTIRREVEEKRLGAAGAYAQTIGLDPNFARSVILQVIAESCRVQIEHRESEDIRSQIEWLQADRKRWHEHLQQSLLRLTAAVASRYDGYYGSAAPAATKMYLEFEWGKIRHEIAVLRAHNMLGTALDLGCATGRLTRLIAPSFNNVLGCDISPEMLGVAKETTAPAFQNIDYFQADIGGGLKNVSSGSVNLVVMNLGTASDIYDIKRVLVSINRVLASGGRFVLSFYNQAALIYHSFVPWQLSLQAKINPNKKYLEVILDGKIYPVFAHLYDTHQVSRLIRKVGLHVSEITTFPTVASILPNPVLEQKAVFDAINFIDQKLSSEKMGAYIIVSGTKRSS